ncbi:MAG: hypothetical protein VB070_03110 [Clostridiaceae bacterium]|nr:hypothetical protein [Clostridiaceae bacterium]
MLSTQMMKLAEKNQWKTNAKEETVFGSFNGYLFTGLEGKKFKTFITPLAGISSEGLKAILKFLKENKRVLSLRNYEASDNFLCVRQQEGLFPLSVEKMEYLMAQISGLLSLYEMPADACAVCGEPAHQRGLYLGLYCHLHPECQDRELVDFTNEPAGQPPLVESAEQSEFVETAETTVTDDPLQTADQAPADEGDESRKPEDHRS